MRLTFRWALGLALVASLGAGVATSQESAPVEPPPAAASEAAPAISQQGRRAIERLERGQAELEALESAWLERRKRQKAEAEARLERVVLLEAELADVESRTEAADDFYDRVVPLVRRSLEELEAAIGEADRASELPPWAKRKTSNREVLETFGGKGSSGLSGDVADRLEGMLSDLRSKVRDLEELELELRLDEVARDLELAGRIYVVRLEALRRLSFERRGDVFGWRDEGMDAMRLEWEALTTLTSLQRFRLEGYLAAASLQIRSFLTALLAGRLLVRLLVIALLWRWLQRGRPQFVRSLRKRARQIDDPQRRRWVQRTIDFFESLAPWSVFVGGVLFVIWAFGVDSEGIPGVYPVLMLLVAYGLYRLAIDLAVSFSVAGMESGGVEMTDELRHKLEVLVRWVMRVAAPVVFVLWWFELRLGAGVLHAQMTWLGTLLVVTVLLVAVLRFRREIRQMFLALRAHGRLADLVRQSEEGWLGYVVTPVAFLWLCWHGVIGLVRGVTLGFERTRSATAYLSRRRMLKVADQRGLADVNVEALPEVVREALDERLTDDDLEAHSGFTGMETALESAGQWRETDAGGSVLLAGEEGLGKGAWLDRFMTNVGGGTRLPIPGRILSPGKLRAWLASELVPEAEGPLDQDALIEALCAGPKRVVALEGAESLFLATVNGYKALAELGPIVDGTRKRIFWVLTIRGLAWGHLRAAGKELSFLRRKFVLDRWSEEQIEALIDRRLASRGLKVNFANLMAVEQRAEDRIARAKLGKETFINLLWDYCGGNPQLALHFFLRSLEETKSGGLDVRPFQTPPEEPLTESGDAVLFLLAAVIRHRGLNARQAATTTAYPVGRVEGLFLHLLDLGTVAAEGDVFRVATSWRATVLRVLKRRNVLTA